MSSRTIIAAAFALLLTTSAFSNQVASTTGAASPAIINTTVFVDVHVDKTGHATRASLVKTSGSKDVDAKALLAAKNWHFNPRMVEGKPTEANVKVPIVVQTYAEPHSQS